MEPKEANVSTKTLSDATNSIVDPAIQVLDPKERKRQRDKARYAALSEEQKSERRKKQQEAYRRPEAVEKRREARNKKQRESDRKENVDPNDQPAGISANENRVDTLSDMSEVWLHTYDAYTTGLIPPIAPGITSETCAKRTHYRSYRKQQYC